MPNEFKVKNGLIVDSGGAQITGGITGSTDFNTIVNRPTLISSSAQVTSVTQTVSGTNSAELVRGNMADNDQFRILVGGTATNQGFAEIATADDGTEPIHVRQYSGVFASLLRTATLLDDTGNTSFPQRVTANSFVGSISASNGVVSGSIQVLGSSTILSGSNSITIAGTSTALGGTITLATITGGSGILSGSTTLPSGVVSGSAQVIGILSSLNTYTGSNDTTNTAQNNRLTNLETTSASVNGHIADINSKTGSYARTNSTNTFSTTQIISGSLYITQDLVVQGSSSIQTISSSRLDIGDNIIQLNVNSPSLRFGGLAINDSGSAGNSGSFLYDSVEDEFIFVHKGNGTNVTSSHFITGPETYDNLGNETYLTTNRLPKATGKEHIVDSNITDTGTLITLASNTVVNGTFVASGTSLVSGSAQVVAMLSSLNTYTGSNDTTNTTQNTRLSRIEESTSSLNTLTGSLATTYEGRASATKTLFSGSSQVTLSSTTGYGTVINQNLLTTSNVQHASLGIGMAASGTAGRIDASGDIVAFSTSDKKFKENIIPIQNALEKISKISGNTYDWKPDMKEFHGFEGNDVGVIAQEIEEVLPQLVTTRETGYKAVKYDKLVALLIEGIKEQQQQIHSLTIEIEKLKESKGL